MKKGISFIIAAVMLMSLTACGRQDPQTSAEASPDTSPKTEIVKDTKGNEFTLPMKMDRVIVLNTNVYEMICVLGKDDNVIGLADSVNYPTSADAKDKYGSFTEPNVERILEAEPDAVFAYSSNFDSGIAAQITEAGIPVILLNFTNMNEIPNETILLGKLFGAEGRAQEYLDDLEEIKSLVKEKTKDLSPITIYYEGNTDYSSAGAPSGYTEFFDIANVKSITESQDVAYPKISDEYVLESNPKIVVKTVFAAEKVFGNEITDNSKAKGIYDGILARPGWSDIDAVKNGKVLVLSSRIGKCSLGTALFPMYMAKMAYPEEFKDINPDEYLDDMLQKYWGTKLSGIWSYAG